MADEESISKLVIDVEVNDKKALLALNALQQRIKNFNSSNGGKAISDMASNMEKMTRNTAQARREAGQFIEQIKKNNKNLMPTDLYGKSMKQYQKELATAQDKMKSIMSTSAPDNQLKGLERYTVQAQMARNAIAELKKEQQKSSSNSLANFTKIEADNGKPLTEGEFERIRAEMQGKGISRSSYFSDKTEDEMALFQKETKAAEELQQKIERISRKIKQLSAYAPSKAGASEKLSKEYLDLEKNIDKASQKLQNLYTKEALMKNAKPGTERYQKLQIDIKNAKSELDGLVSKMRELQLSGKDITSIPKPTQFSTKIDYTPTKLKGGESYSKDYIRLTKEIERAENALEKLKFKQEMMKNSDPGTERYKTLQYNIAKATQNAEELARRMRDLQASGKDVDKVDIGTKFKDAIKSADKLSSSLKKSFGDIGKEISKLPQKLMKPLLRLGTMFRAMLLRRFIMQVFKSMKEAVDQLAQYSNTIGSDFNKSVSSIVDNFKYLGRVIVTAFEPLINFAAPIIDFLIQKIVDAINAINQFVNAIFGNSTWTKASYNASNYADSLDKASGSAKKLKAQLQGFDELNNLSSNQGGGGSGGGGGAANVGDLFSTQQISESAKGMAERFKEAWKNADFTDIGRDIADKITNALNGIPWDGIKTTANKIAKSIATFLNGFINPDLFGAVGKTLAESLNTVFGAIGTFANVFDWSNLGKSVASTINKFFTTFDFKQAGMTLTSVASGILTAVTDAVQNVKWEDVGAKVFEFISNIDWIKLIGQSTVLILEIKTAIYQLFIGAVSQIASNLSDLFSELGLDSIAGFLKGFSIGSMNVAEEMRKKLETILNAVKNFFGISNGNSQEFSKIGDNCVKGLKDGISNAVSGISEWMKTNVTDKVLGALNGVKDITINIKGNIEDSFNKAKDAFNNVKNSDAVKTLKGKAEKTWDNVKSAWDKIKSEGALKTLKGTTDKTFTGLKDKWDKLKSKTVTLTGKAKNQSSSVLKTMTDAWDKLKTKSAEISVRFSDFFSAPLKRVFNGLVTSINNAIGAINKIPGVNIAKLSYIAKGGAFYNGDWHNIAQYANGGVPGHGSLFLAGEDGPEILGHVGGRTEVLNQSQLASTMYSAVFSAMQAANGNGSQPIQVYLDGKVVFDSTRQYAQDYTRRTGIPAF